MTEEEREEIFQRALEDKVTEMDKDKISKSIIEQLEKENSFILWQ